MKFSIKDNLYTKFRKIADYLAKNTDEDLQNETVYRQIIETLAPVYFIGKDVELFDDKKAIGLKEGDLFGEKVEFITKMEALNEPYLVPFQVMTQKGFALYFGLISRNNKNQSKQGNIFWYNAYPDITFLTLGLNRSYGYSILVRDLIEEFKKQDSDDLEKEIFNKVLFELVHHRNSSKKRTYLYVSELDEYLFQHWNDEANEVREMINQNGDKVIQKIIRYKNMNFYETYEKLQRAVIKNKVLKFVNNYIDRLYGWALKFRYESDIEKQTRAKAWEQKKNINKATQQAMKESKLNEYFSRVEFDNDVDLSKVPIFTKEVCSLMKEVLPKGISQSSIRLRKLGNYKALGMFIPLGNELVVDFRDNEDYIGTSLNGVGIQSFVHEYGHYLDYYYRERNALSMSVEFSKIVRKYTDKLKKLARDDSELNDTQKKELTFILKKYDYYCTPTEIFARSFEIYMSGIGLVSSVLKPKEIYSEDVEYLSLSDAKEDITAYFDKLFPDLRDKVREYGYKEGGNDKDNKVEEYNPKLKEEQVNGVVELAFDFGF